MDSKSDQARQQTEEVLKVQASRGRRISPDFEARARDVRKKMQYLRSLRAKLEKEQNDKQGR